MFDNTQALNEGWDLFDVDGRLQLQKVDDPTAHQQTGVHLDYAEPKFDSDAAAIIYVAKQADAGSEYHMTAIGLIGTLAE